MSKRKYSREFDREIKYLRKTLKGANQRLLLPEGLRAESMRAMLDDVENPYQPPAHLARSAFVYLRPRVFSLQSAVSYAVAFILIVAVVYAFRLNDANVIDGTMVLETERAEADTGGEVQSYAVEMVPESGAEVEMIQDDGLATDQARPFGVPVAGEEPQAGDEPPLGLGGGAQAVQLETSGRYTYLYRVNDRTDPDKGAYPITLEIVDGENAELLWQVDLPDIQQIDAFALHEGGFCLAGPGEQGATLRSYSLAGDEPNLLGAVNLPGQMVRVWVEGETLYGVTICSTEQDPGWPGTELEGSVSENLCLVAALEAPTGRSVQAAFGGAGDSVALDGHDLEISYTRQTGELEEPASAGVRLNGLDITLS